MEAVAKRVGKKLQELRKINNFTQQYVADFCGTGKSSVSNWENGLSIPGSRNMAKLTQLYNVTQDYLFLEELSTETINKKHDSLPIPILDNLTSSDDVLSTKKIIGYVYERESKLKSNSHNYFCLKAPDDTMNGARIRKDDIILVKMKKTLEHADIGVVFVDGELVIRRVIKTNGNNAVLHGETYGHLPDSVILRKKHKILGKVIEVRVKVGDDD